MMAGPTSSTKRPLTQISEQLTRRPPPPTTCTRPRRRSDLLLLLIFLTTCMFALLHIISWHFHHDSTSPHLKNNAKHKFLQEFVKGKGDKNAKVATNATRATKEHTTAHSDLLARATINNETKLLATDSIYSRDWWEKPTVIEEYKLIFFTVPKVASTEWKLLFRTMMGMEPPGNDENILKYQDPATNNLTHLGDYSLADAEGMMKSPEWTKAVFVREPKERVLSAFIDKFINKDYFLKKCCKRSKVLQRCQVARKDADFGYFLTRTLDCHDPHWLPQYGVIDEKWWPYINFIGYMHNVAHDSKQLLQSLHSSAKYGGMSSGSNSAWANVGASGWGPNGTEGFMQINHHVEHATGAKDAMRKYYTKQREAFVEKNWAVEWNNAPYYSFEPLELFFRKNETGSFADCIATNSSISNIIDIGSSENHPDQKYVIVSCHTLPYRMPAMNATSIEEIFIGVLSAAGGSGPARRNSIRETWASGERHSVFFIVAGPWNEIQAEYEEYKDLIWLDQEEIYDGEKSVLTFKTMTFIKIAHEIAASPTLKIKYAFKTDDDSFVNVKYLHEFLLETDREEKYDYWGQCTTDFLSKPKRDVHFKWSISREIYPEEYYPPYCQGAGFALSLNFLWCAGGPENHIAQMRFMPFEDVAVGLLAERCGIVASTAANKRLLNPTRTSLKLEHDHVKHGLDKIPKMFLTVPDMEGRIVQHRIHNEWDMMEHYKQLNDPKNYMKMTTFKWYQPKHEEIYRWATDHDNNPNAIKKIKQAPKSRFRPLIFGCGFGTTATITMFKSTCHLRLRSLHYEKQCGFGLDRMYDAQNPKVPTPGVLAHERLLRAHKALKDCVLSSTKASTTCPSVKDALHDMCKHIDEVLSCSDVDALHDTPYPEFAEYVIEAAERIRGSKPIVLLSERDPKTWANRRVEHNDDLVCKINAATATSFVGTNNSLPGHLGQNLYWCLQTAIQNNMGDVSISDIFWNVHHLIDSGVEADNLVAGMQLYQDTMRGKAIYRANLFERPKKINFGKLAGEIEAAVKPLWNTKVEYIGNSEFTSDKKCDELIYSDCHKKKNRTDRFSVRRTPYFDTEKGCMPSFKMALSTGRFCDKLVIFLHFHKAGGSSIIDYMISRGLWYDLRIYSDPKKLGMLQEGHDLSFGGYGRNHLMIHSSATNPSAVKSRIFDSEFWESIYDRGIDVVNLEYNFIPPDLYFRLAPLFWKIVQIRDPWARFRSTYERELHITCKKWDKLDLSKKEGCYRNRDHSLERWMLNYTGVMGSKRLEEWVGILYPNYYVRMLNGMGDWPPKTRLTRDHLEKAKAVLNTFDAVLVLEDTDDINMQKLHGMFGKTSEEVDPMPNVTNNLLKFDPIYGLISKETAAMKRLFEDQNQLDIELYNYARYHFSKLE